MEKRPLLNMLKMYFQSNDNVSLMDIIKNIINNKNIEDITDMDVEEYLSKSLISKCGD